MTGAAGKSWNDTDWREVDIPHDYYAESEMNAECRHSHGYRTEDNAWYRKSFLLDESLSDKHLVLVFEGTAVHAEFYFNGKCAFKTARSSDGALKSWRLEYKAGEQLDIRFLINARNRKEKGGAGFAGSVWFEMS